MRSVKIAQIILRIGIAIAFLYPPINALSDPNSWIGYFPPFTRGIVPDEILLYAFGIVEVIVALWLLSGWKVFYPALIAAAMLIGIVVFNIPQFQVV
ncbi:MAG TPA: DoxX family membrane protein, partial [Candidatus Paceibacterota bacterium]|nr:DoxX family membrane protein [Candidatus Paceibacterota bacterium]